MAECLPLYACEMVEKSHSPGSLWQSLVGVDFFCLVTEFIPS